MRKMDFVRKGVSVAMAFAMAMSSFGTPFAAYAEDGGSVLF